MIARTRRHAASYTGFSPNARRFLLVSLIVGAATSLFWVDFNLYLRALGFDEPSIGVIVTFGSAAAVIVSLPASWASDRLGRRAILLVSLALIVLSVAGFTVATTFAAIAVLSVAYGAGQQAFWVVSSPFMVENSRAEQRSEFFALQFAVVTATNFAAALGGGLLAQLAGRLLGVGASSAPALRVLIVAMLVLAVLGVAVCATLAPDRPSRPSRPSPTHLPAAAAQAGRTAGARVADPRLYLRLLVPGFLIGLGAGQVIPFLNLYVERRFGLDIATLNAVFAVTSLGTVAAILLQPALARRYGKIGSVVIVQAASIPFLVVLGYAPVFAAVAAAMVIRNALMNAGNPIFTAFALERVRPAERATLTALMSISWAAAWALGGPWYALLQRELGFQGGYAVNFAVMIVCYSVATAAYWVFFRRTVTPATGR